MARSDSGSGGTERFYCLSFGVKNIIKIKKFCEIVDEIPYFIYLSFTGVLKDVTLSF